MRTVFLIWVVCAACNDDGGARHIVDGQGSGSATGPTGVVEVVIEDGGSTYGAAMFSTQPGPPILPPTCTVTTVGTCSVTTCTTTPTSMLGIGDDAGTVTISGAAETVTLVATPDHSYSFGPDDTDPPFAPGDMVTMSGAGATVPAFTQVVTMPTPMRFDAPVLAAMVPRNSDLTLAWSNGNHNSLVAFELFHQTPYTALTCTFTDHPDAGTVAVPSSLLQLMPPGSTIALGFGYAITNGTVGDYATAFYAGSVATSPAGGDYQVNVIMQ